MCKCDSQWGPSSNEKPIGLFDSGLGGLTVLKAVRETLPHERLVFLGDTARVPYGTRSQSTVVRYALACARRLMEYEVKCVVVACNTVSALALDALRLALPLPVLGVIEPGAKTAVAASQEKRIGVIATASTAASGAYERAIRNLDPDADVWTNAAPLLVPLVEEGWLEGTVPRLAMERYLEPLVRQDIDALVLGCTHYPLLRHVAEDVLGQLSSRKVNVVDSAQATAIQLSDDLRRLGLLRTPVTPDQGAAPKLRLLVTDSPIGFTRSASRFLSKTVTDLDVEQIDITDTRHVCATHG